MADGGAAAAAAAPTQQAAATADAFSPSVGQVSFVLVYLWVLGLYVYSALLKRSRAAAAAGTMGKAHLSDPDIESKMQGVVTSVQMGESAPLMANGGGSCTNKNTSTSASPSKDLAAACNGKSSGSFLHDFWSSSLCRCVALEEDALVDANATLLHIVEFGAILVWFFLCDRTNVFWQSEKSYNRDLFTFLFVCLTAVALGASLQPVRLPLLLNRPQTEEWKGWMQVLFLLYHYFEARELYNAIRIFIAGYVWMTGYGNFTYYYRTGDFSVGRFCQMMWRLNFLVVCCCVVLRNSYMLYYICPMHTIFTVLVYAALGIAPRLNKTPHWMWTKIALCFLAVFVLWDIKAVFYAIWQPLDWLVGYTDPRKGAQDRLHEWYFRSGLDRYVWIWGMVCAYLHPAATKALNAIEELPRARQAAVRAAVLGAVGGAALLYYHAIYALPKVEYNKVHPFTSWIPLTLWVVARNVTPGLRTWSARLYGWLGCITLETYLCQFHIWLHTDLADGQPKYLLTLVPGYPMVNFALVSALYVFVSNRLFHLTNELKDRVVPHDDDRLLARNAVQGGLAAAAACAIGWLVQRTVVLHFF